MSSNQEVTKFRLILKSGYTALFSNKPKSDNPYDIGTLEYRVWLYGYTVASYNDQYTKDMLTDDSFLAQLLTSAISYSPEHPLQDFDIHERNSWLLFDELRKCVPEQVKAVFEIDNQYFNELEPSFLGFVTTYKMLAEIIPVHLTVVDIGCNAAAQSWYFRKHVKYIGIDRDLQTRFAMTNTVHLEMYAEEFLSYDQINPAETFMILNYVPINSEIRLALQQKYPNNYHYYPTGIGINPFMSIINNAR